MQNEDVMVLLIVVHFQVGKKLTCSWCPFSHHNISVLAKHFQRHYAQDGYTEFPCPYCRRKASSGRNWKRHVQLHIRSSDASRITVRHENQDEVVADDADEADGAQQSAGPSCSSNRGRRVDVAKFFGKLHYSFNIPSSVCTYIADQHLSLWQSTVDDIQRKINSELPNSGVNITTLSQDSETLAACAEFRSKYKLERFIREELPFVAPGSVFVKNSSGRWTSFQHISILGQLKILLSNEHILDYVLSEKMRDENIVDISDGSMHQHHRGQIRLALYYDDFNAVDPLGNKVSKYKLAGIYFSVLNIPVHLRSQLNSIYLALVCMTHQVKEHGWQVLLKNIVTEAKVLREEGITITKAGKSLTIYGTVSCVVGDNLALHSLGGFSQSFNSGKCCRFCLADVTEQQTAFDESKVTLRNPETYRRHISDLRAAEFPTDKKQACGIYAESALCSLHEDFPIERLVPDVAHDLLEGVVPYVLVLILTELINAKLFSLSFINNRISSFDFKERNRPQKLCKVKGKLKVKQTASEMWLLLRVLPLLLGDCVPQNHIIWTLLINLCQLVENILAPQFTNGAIMYLEELTSSWLTDLKACFPDFRIKPKFHHMIHYGTQIRRHGPLRHLWTLRYESKHGPLKKAAQRANNRKNLPKTIALRHQQALALTLDDESYMSSERASEFKSTTADPLQMPEELQAQITASMQTGSSVSVGSTQYCVGDTLLIREKDGLSFSVIRNVLQETTTDEFKMLVERMETEFDYHVNAYKLTSSNILEFVTFGKLADYHPLRVYQKNGNSYAIMRWHVE